MIFKKGDKVKIYWRGKTFRCGGDCRGIIKNINQNRFLIQMKNGNFIIHDIGRWLHTEVEFMWHDMGSRTHHFI